MPQPQSDICFTFPDFYLCRNLNRESFSRFPIFAFNPRRSLNRESVSRFPIFPFTPLRLHLRPSTRAHDKLYPKRNIEKDQEERPQNDPKPRQRAFIPLPVEASTQCTRTWFASLSYHSSYRIADPRGQTMLSVSRKKNWGAAAVRTPPTAPKLTAAMKAALIHNRSSG